MSESYGDGVLLKSISTHVGLREGQGHKRQNAHFTLPCSKLHSLVVQELGAVGQIPISTANMSVMCLQVCTFKQNTKVTRPGSKV